MSSWLLCYYGSLRRWSKQTYAWLPIQVKMQTGVCGATSIMTDRGC